MVEAPRSTPPPGGTWHDRVAVVVNGNAKRVTGELVEMLDQIVQSGDLFVSRSLAEGREIARTIAERGYPTVLTGGGDGTFVQVVTWVTQSCDALGKPRPRFGFLRLGTGNAIAWVLGAQGDEGKGVVADLGRLRRTGGSRPLRLLDVEGTLTPFAGLGLDSIALDHYAQTRERFAKTPLLRRFAGGGATYLTSVVTRTLPEFLFRPHPRVRVINEGGDALVMGSDGRPRGAPIPRGGVLYDGPSRLVAFSTIPYWGFGARIFPYADDRDDRFSLRVVDITSAEVVRHIRAIWDGSYRSENIHDFLCERASVHFEEELPLQIGGDLCGPRRDLTVALSPRPIDVVDYYAPPPVT
jgi:diacylglycerol kinase family enzyme